MAKKRGLRLPFTARAAAAVKAAKVAEMAEAAMNRRRQYER